MKNERQNLTNIKRELGKTIKKGLADGLFRLKKVRLEKIVPKENDGGTQCND